MNQMYINDWLIRKPVSISSFNSEKLSEIYSRTLEVTSFLSKYKKMITKYCIIFEEGEKEHKLHHQGLLVHNYKKKQNLSEVIDKLAKSKNLEGKISEWGVSKQCEKGEEENLIYILKNQKDLTYVSYVGYTSEYLESLIGVWKPKDQFITEEREKRKIQRAKGLSYSHEVVKAFEEKYDVTEELDDRYKMIIADFVNQKVGRDKSRLPKNMIVELIRYMFLKYGLINKTSYLENLISCV